MDVYTYQIKKLLGGLKSEPPLIYLGLQDKLFDRVYKELVMRPIFAEFGRLWLRLGCYFIEETRALFLLEVKNRLSLNIQYLVLILRQMVFLGQVVMSSQIFETLLMLLTLNLFVVHILITCVCNNKINLGTLIRYQMSWLFVQELFNLAILNFVENSL